MPLWLDMPNIGMYIILIRMQFSVGICIYADLDYECIDALDSLLENEFCCLASDPEEHARIFDKAHIVTNAFIAIEAGLRYMGLELISGKWYHA